MSSDSTQDLARALVADLRKVRRQPRLDVQLLALAGLWAGVTLATLWGMGGAGALVSPMDYWLSGCVAVALLLLAGAATVAGVAAATPGLEVARNRAAGLGLAGFALAVVSCLAVAAGAGVGGDAGFSADLSCFGHALGLAVVPAAVALFLAVRGWVAAPALAAGLALAGAAAFGALLTQLTCPLWIPRHLLLGHLGAPFVLVVVGTAPLALLLRRLAR